MLTVNKLARIKRVMDDMELKDIPVGDDVDSLVKVFIISLTGKAKSFNEFFEIITGEKKDYHSGNILEVMEIAKDFFTSIDALLKELIVTILRDKKLQYEKEVVRVQEMQTKAMMEALKKHSETDSLKSATSSENMG